MKHVPSIHRDRQVGRVDHPLAEEACWKIGKKEYLAEPPRK